MIRIGAIAAIIGGVIGFILLFLGPNTYGNYTWHGPLAFAVPLLFAVGFGGGIALFGNQSGRTGQAGMLLIVAGLLLHSIGQAFIDILWWLTGIGPIVVVPVGAIILGITILRRPFFPIWWRYFPLLIIAIAFLGFGIEIYEDVSGYSTPDRGLQATEALYSLVWIGLGSGLWRGFDDSTDDSPMAA